MYSIGVRELRQNASRYLRDVQRGETIEVTDRGRPVARLVPIARSGTLEQLSADGRLTETVADLLDLGPPLAPRSEVPLPSAALAAARDDER